MIAFNYYANSSTIERLKQLVYLIKMLRQDVWIKRIKDDRCHTGVIAETTST